MTSDNSHYSIVKDLLQLTSGVTKTPKIQHSTADQSLDCLSAQLRAVNLEPTDLACVRFSCATHAVRCIDP